MCLINKAWEIASHYHKGQMYGRHPYMQHLSDVHSGVFTLSRKTKENKEVLGCVAVLHDLFEYTSCTEEELVGRLGGEHCLLTEEVIFCLNVLTKEKGWSREEYLHNIIRNKKLGISIPWMVEVADAYSNLTESIKINDSRRIAKYCDTLKILNECDI